MELHVVHQHGWKRQRPRPPLQANRRAVARELQASAHRVSTAGAVAPIHRGPAPAHRVTLGVCQALRTTNVRAIG
jgi:hypothetical protein